MENISFCDIPKIKKKTSVAIWGACVTREIFNYINNVEITTYIIQNPIHTVFSKPFTINEEIEGTSAFTKRCLTYECTKTAFSIIENNIADYLIIDTSDCRNDYYQWFKDKKCRICQSLSSDLNFGEKGKWGSQFERKSVFGIKDREWKMKVNKFCERISNIYDENRIILNEFSFADYYLKEGELSQYDHMEYYKKQNRVTSYVAELIKNRMPNIMTVKAYQNPIGNYYHHLGNHPLHYVDDVYIEQARKIEKLLF